MSTMPIFSVYVSERKCSSCGKQSGEMWWVPKRRLKNLFITRLCDGCTPERIKDEAGVTPLQS